MGATMIDTLITHRMRSDGAEEATEKRKLGDDIAENIKVTESLTAGVLVANGLHSLDDPISSMPSENDSKKQQKNKRKMMQRKEQN